MIYSARPNLDAKSQSLSDKSLSHQGLSLRIHQPSRFDEPSRLEEIEALAHESHDEQFDLELATHIISRIESRLPGRIRHLTVYTTENAVILTGECSTFYTKQVAQHAAMGVLEYEQLINNIDVRTVK